MLNDSDDMVRISACDSLSISNNPRVIELLKKMIVSDNSSLVRSYAVMSICDIAINMNFITLELVEFLRNRLKKERAVNTKISFFRSLYLLGEKEYISALICELNGLYYKNRCAAANALIGLYNDENSETIINAFMERKSKEKTVAVLDTINQFLN